MSISEDDNSIISNYVAIAPNEYVTKYSFNRNFEKLVYNDDVLAKKLDEAEIETYNKNKTYDKDKIVFYKIQKTDPTLYVLSSLVGPNMHKPLVRKNFTTGKLNVINGEYWAVVGALNEGVKGSTTAKDTANTYISDSSNIFETKHLNNLDLDAHPTGKLGMKDSSILFRTFENVNDDRSHFHYPYELRSYIANDAIHSGYMRKWDNGILEYDLVFKLSYAGKADDGTDLISANNYKAVRLNSNFIYFKNDEDYNIFNLGGEYYVNINGTKLVNLNKTINAYSSKLEFLEPFKDTNYMVFTSNVKNVETESYNTKNEIVTNYDDRLILNGRTIINTKADASFRMPLIIPDSILNIKSLALGYLKKVNDYPVDILINEIRSELINIDNEAFIYSDIETMSFPYTLRYIGKNAFMECSLLTSLIFYVERDPKLWPRIDSYAFSNTNILSISVIYKAAPLTFSNAYSSTDEQYDNMFLYSTNDVFHEKFYSANYLYTIGINKWPIDIYTENAPEHIALALETPIMFSVNNDNELSNESAVNDTSVDNTNSIITIDVNEFLAELSAYNELRMMNNSSSMLFRANTPTNPTIDNVFSLNGNTITGYNDDIILSNAIEFNLNNKASIHAIGSNALANFDKLTSLSIGTYITHIESNAFGSLFNKLVLTAYTDFNFSTTDFNTLCIFNINNKKLSVGNVENCYYFGNNGTINSHILCANHITNLYISNVTTIAEAAFADVNKIENVYINSNNSATNILKMIFKTEFITEDDDSWYEMNVNKLHLIGNKFQILASAFMGIDLDYLSIDLNGSYLTANAFYGGGIDMLELKNLYSGLSSNGFKGLYAHSLCCCEIPYLKFSDINDVAVSNIIIPFSSIGLEYPCMIGNLNTSMIYNGNNDFESIPSYLSVTNTNAEKLTAATSMLIIPRGITTINSLHDNSDEDNYNMVEYIFIPNTVTKIADNAFKDFINLDDVLFEPGIQLTSIGSDIFAGCLDLLDIVIP